MGLEIYLGRKEYPVKCQLYAPVYAKVGNDVKVISHEPSEIFIWCKETKPFETTEEREMNRRKKTTKGTLETISLKQDEIKGIESNIDEQKKILHKILEDMSGLNETAEKHIERRNEHGKNTWRTQL